MGFIFIAVIGFFIVFFVYCIIENKRISVSETEIISKKLPKEFNGYKIAVISDLHNAVFGKNQQRLTEKLKALNADIIVFPGDIINRYNYGTENVLPLIKECVSLAPVYFVSGNHEKISASGNAVFEMLHKLNVRIINDCSETIEKSGAKINIIGISDKFEKSPDFKEKFSAMADEQLKKLKNDGYNILLIHRPDGFNTYSAHNIDLSICGHIHGGHIRLPIIGGLLSPDRKFFPKYSAGLYKSGDSFMYVSRGMGNSSFKIRMFNPPELAVITLKTK